MSFGEELRRERKLREISLREVAQSTKISLRYLEALERNDFDNLPGGVFNRGFVRAYAQFIGVDPESMVNAYLLEERAAGLAPESSAEGARGKAGRGRLVWLWIVLVLIVIAGGAYIGWSRWGGGKSERPPTPVEEAP